MFVESVQKKLLKSLKTTVEKCNNGRYNVIKYRYELRDSPKDKENSDMKRILAVVLCCMMAVGCLTGCGKKCDICGESGSVKTYEIFGEEINLCKDCSGF